MAEVIKAVELAKDHKAVSVAEFFEKNRHLLGFGSKRQALLSCVKEAVDNALDACEEANILPDVKVGIKEMGKDKYKVIVQDNGPGIVKENLSHAFGKLLYGSKFHGQRQGRGQQGIGITSCVLYGQLTTGKSALIISKIHKSKPAHYIRLILDTKKNEPKILEEGVEPRFTSRGTRVELDIVGEFLSSGKQSVEEYLRRTSIVNPHAAITFVKPNGEKVVFKRTSNKLPVKAKRIKPHPDGLELGILLKMLMNTSSKSLPTFLKTEFSSIGSKTANEIIEKAKLEKRIHPAKLSRDDAERLLDAMKEVQIQAPPTDCLSPIGDDALRRSMKSEIEAEFYTTLTRKPTAYRGMPFQVEIGLAYGGDLPKDNKIQVFRFANKVPLVYEDYACAITQAVKKTAWKRYGIETPGGFPKGPIILVVHLCSVWVPFTSEGKQAIASYPAIIKEIRLGLMDVARKLQIYLNKKFRERKKAEKISTFVKYSGEVASAIASMTGEDEKKIYAYIKDMLIKKFGESYVVNEETET